MHSIGDAAVDRSHWRLVDRIDPVSAMCVRYSIVMPFFHPVCSEEQQAALHTAKGDRRAAPLSTCLTPIVGMWRSHITALQG